MNNIINIKDYKTTNFIHPKKIYSFVTIILILLIIIFIISLFKFDFHYYTKATYIKDSDTLMIITDDNDLNKITSHDKLIIDNKEYQYKVRKIDKKILNGISIQQYNEILISLKLDEKHKIENNSINIKVKYSQKTFFEIIKEFILGRGE